MNIVYLNGKFLPIDQASISPMDRGFLFGEGIYEVIPSYEGRLVGFDPHMNRMQAGLTELKIDISLTAKEWLEIINKLLELNDTDNLGIYLQVTRGADTRRYHAYPEGITPTIFAYTFKIPPAPTASKMLAPKFSCATAEDKRWDRCNIKSTSLLGNVMHFQWCHEKNEDEVILYSSDKEITEASTCNVFLVKDNVIKTPLLDNQKLPGITRMLLLDMVRQHSEYQVEEDVVKLDEIYSADEIWLTSSTKEIAPVIQVDGKTIGNGEIGDIWLAVQTLFCEHRFDY